MTGEKGVDLSDRIRTRAEQSPSSNDFTGVELGLLHHTTFTLHMFFNLVWKLLRDILTKYLSHHHYTYLLIISLLSCPSIFQKEGMNGAILSRGERKGILSSVIQMKGRLKKASQRKGELMIYAVIRVTAPRQPLPDDAFSTTRSLHPLISSGWVDLQYNAPLAFPACHLPPFLPLKKKKKQRTARRYKDDAEWQDRLGLETIMIWSLLCHS